MTLCYQRASIRVSEQGWGRGRPVSPQRTLSYPSSSCLESLCGIRCHCPPHQHPQGPVHCAVSCRVLEAFSPTQRPCSPPVCVPGIVPPALTQSGRLVSPRAWPFRAPSEDPTPSLSTLVQGHLRSRPHFVAPQPSSQAHKRPPGPLLPARPLAAVPACSNASGKCLAFLVSNVCPQRSALRGCRGSLC